MKRKLSSLMLLLIIVTVALAAPAGAAESGAVAAGTAPREIPAPPATASAASAAAPSLLRQAADALHQQRSVSAQMRHRIGMFGHQLVGTGSYQQQGAGDERMLRLDMKVKVGDSLTSMQQVCDGRFLWIRRDIGDAQFLGRVDLRRIQEATAAAAAPQATADATTYWMMLGGLPQLLARLDSHFRFAAPREATLARTPVWVLDGTWQPDMLAQLAPDQAESLKAGKPLDVAALAEHIPTQVRVILRRSDNFPLQVEYLRQGVAENADQPPPVTPLLAMELFDIRLGEAIDPLVFAYKPGDKEVVDHTELYLKNLGLK